MSTFATAGSPYTRHEFRYAMEFVATLDPSHILEELMTGEVASEVEQLFEKMQDDVVSDEALTHGTAYAIIEQMVQREYEDDVLQSVFEKLFGVYMPTMVEKNIVYWTQMVYRYARLGGDAEKVKDMFDYLVNCTLNWRKPFMALTFQYTSKGNTDFYNSGILYLAADLTHGGAVMRHAVSSILHEQYDKHAVDASYILTEGGLELFDMDFILGHYGDARTVNEYMKWLRDRYADVVLSARKLFNM